MRNDWKCIWRKHHCGVPGLFSLCSMNWIYSAPVLGGSFSNYQCCQFHLQSKKLGCTIGSSIAACNHLNTLFFFFFFWLSWVFIAAHRFSPAAASRGYSSLQCVGFSLQLLLLLRSTGSRHAGFSSCGLSCSTACGIFPDQGSKPCPLHWQVDS